MAFSSVASDHFVQLGREILHYPKAQELGLDLPPLPSACYIGRTGVFDGCSAPVLSNENMRIGVSAPRSRSRRWASASVGDCLQIVSEVSVVATLTSFSSMLYVSSILVPQNVPMKPWLTRTAGGSSLSSHQFCMDELRAFPELLVDTVRWISQCPSGWPLCWTPVPFLLRGWPKIIRQRGRAEFFDSANGVMT